MNKIIIDTLGGDNGAEPIVRGAFSALKNNPEISVILTGIKEEIEKIIENSDADKSRIEILHTTEYVSDSDLPTCVFNGCDNTSMVMSLEKLKNDNEITAMLCAGNTGALLVGTIFRLGLVKGLRYPALATALPCKKDGLVCLTDCGANTECTAEDLKRFALLGNAYMKCLTGTENPKVALMSVGHEAHKGNAIVKEAYPLIENLPVNFIGNIEGNDLINSEADVIVTDGFTGNILLKNTEAAGRAAMAVVDSIGKDSEICTEIKNTLYNMFAFNDLGGATFLGCIKPVVKMHGCANEKTVSACVDLAVNLTGRNFIQEIAGAITC